MIIHEDEKTNFIRNKEELAKLELLRTIPYAVSIPRQVSSVSIGKQFSMALTSFGELFTWG